MIPKYRAWHKERKEYISHGELFNLDCSNEYPFLALIEGHYVDEGMDIVLEQYTGWIDQELNELYINDIIEMVIQYFGTIPGQENEEVTTIGVLRFNEYGYYLEDNKKEKHSLYNVVGDNLLRLGNIHENKELLKK